MSGTEAAQKKVGVFHVRSRFRRLPRCYGSVRYRPGHRELTVSSGLIIMHRHDGVGVIEDASGKRLAFHTTAAEFAVGQRVQYVIVHACGRDFADKIVAA